MFNAEYSASDLRARADATDSLSMGGTDEALDARMHWAKRDSAKYVQVQRWSAWVRLAVAAGVSAAVWSAGAPIGAAVVLTVVLVAGAVVATVNSWAAQLYVLAVFAPDQGLYLHAEQLRATADASESATRHVVDRTAGTRGPFRTEG